MNASDAALRLADAALPLAALGNRVAVERCGNAVRYGCGHRSATVELQPDGRLSAAFGERGFDAVTGLPATWLYRRASGRYALTPADGRRMAADMVDFFSGLREPAFRFVGVMSED